MFESPIIITLPDSYANEHEAVEALVDAGAGIIHIRKPGLDESGLRKLLERTGEGYRKKLTVHYASSLAEELGLGGVHDRKDVLRSLDGGFRKSASCHSWKEVLEMKDIAGYVFLSPVFDSISKEGYRAGFDTRDLKAELSGDNRPPVVALGGVKADNISFVREIGFDGAALLGAVWTVENGRINIEKSVNDFMEINMRWNELK